MNAVVEDVSVLSLVREYRDYYVELQAIQKEISNFRKKFAKRLKEIKDKLCELESKIMNYMKKHNHPGLRLKDQEQFDEVLLLLEDKISVKNQKTREEEAKKIFQKHNIDQTNPLYREIIDSLQSSRIHEGSKRLRLKMQKKAQTT